MKVLLIGDLYGISGVEFLIKNLPNLKKCYNPNLIIVNAENAHEGRGITKKLYKSLMASGVSLLTMGNHTFGNREIYELFADPKINIIRPINYRNLPGCGYKVINYNNQKVLVINALGRAFMNPNLENPFLAIEKVLQEVAHDYAIVDFHAESTSEKVALGHFLDGKVNLVVGTHTHIPTADERKLPKGTLYITDLGMTGPYNGVIGVEKETIIAMFLDGYSGPKKVAKGSLWLNGVIADFDSNQIKRVQIIKE